MHVLVVVHLVGIQVPEEFLGMEDIAVDIAHHHPAAQLPELLPVQIGGIGLDDEVNVELLVEALHQHALHELPGRLLAVDAVVDVPLLDDHVIAHHTAVADERVDAPGLHEQKRVLSPHGLCQMLHFGGTGEEKKKERPPYPL